MAEVSIIIVTYNSEPFICSCLKSIFEQRTKHSYEVIVVDNHSRDNTRNIVSQFDHVQLIVNTKNMGYSKANNIGLNKASGKYILFLNPDVLLAGNAIDLLIESLEEDSTRGIVAPRLVYNNGEVQESARRYPNVWVQTVFRLPVLKSVFKKQYEYYMMRDWDHQSSRTVDWVIGAVMLCRRTVIEQLGGFDEDFFLYCEDLDLCYRLRQAGYQIYYNSKVSLIHQYQRSSSRTFSKLTLIHLSSIFKFYCKHPELAFRKVR